MARSLDPESPEAPELMGRIHLKRGDYDAAVDALSEALSLGTARRDTLALAATAFAARGDVDKAIEHYEAALELDPDVDLRLNLATLLAREERRDEARAQLQAAQERRPYSPRVRFAIAQLYGLVGNLDFSRQQCEEVLRLEPRHQAAKMLLAEILFRQGEESERAARLLREVVEASGAESDAGQRALAMLQENGAPDDV